MQMYSVLVDYSRVWWNKNECWYLVHYQCRDHPIQEAFSESIHGKIHINKPRFECDINDFHFHIHLRLWVLLSTSYLQPCVQYLCLNYYTGKFAPIPQPLPPRLSGVPRWKTQCSSLEAHIHSMIQIGIGYKRIWLFCLCSAQFREILT